MKIKRVELYKKHIESGYGLPDTLSALKEWVDSIVEKVPAEYLDKTFVKMIDYGYGESLLFLEIYYERPMTAEEIAEESEQHAKYEEEQRQNEIAQFEKLRAKYGDSRA